MVICEESLVHCVTASESVIFRRKLHVNDSISRRENKFEFNYI